MTSRAKLLAQWRALHADALLAHKAAVDAGDNDTATQMRRRMKSLANAIKAYTEERQGQFPR